MKSGVITDKNGKMLVGFENPTYEDLSLEEIIEKEGWDDREVRFIPKKKLEKNPMRLKHYHKISEKGAVEDTRKKVGYKATLVREEITNDKKFITDRKKIRVDTEEDAKALAEKLDMKLKNLNPILQTLDDKDSNSAPCQSC